MEWLIPLAGFVLVSSITPGPNNFLLAASGIQFGVRRTLPHLFGVHLGMYTLVILCGLGLGQMLLAIPELLIGLKLFATGYLAYLAWQILGFDLGEGTDTKRPMRPLEAGLFQFTNPKAWMMATAGINITYAVDSSMTTAVLWLCLGFATLGACCSFLWIWAGASLRSALEVPSSRRWINGGLAIVTLATIVAFWVF